MKRGICAYFSCHWHYGAGFLTRGSLSNFFQKLAIPWIYFVLDSFFCQAFKNIRLDSLVLPSCSINLKCKHSHKKSLSNLLVFIFNTPTVHCFLMVPQKYLLASCVTFKVIKTTPGLYLQPKLLLPLLIRPGVYQLPSGYLFLFLSIYGI